MAVAQSFMESLGIPAGEMYFEEKGPHERAHYSSQTFDQLVKVSRWGWVEVSGHSYRGDFDLSRHMKFSGADLTVFKPYPKPVIVKRKRVLVNKAVVGRMFRSEAPKVIAALQALDPEEVEEKVSRGEPLTAGGYTVPPEAVSVGDVEEKVAGRRIVPHVVEPSFGVERLLYVALEHALREKEGRLILSLPRRLAPIQAVVLPLLEEEPLIKKAKEVWELLAKEFRVEYDERGSIGRRYARWDEVGVPAAITVDFQTLEDNTVTIRDRDTWEQVRVKVEDLPRVLREFLKGKDLKELIKNLNVTVVELGCESYPSDCKDNLRAYATMLVLGVRPQDLPLLIVYKDGRVAAAYQLNKPVDVTAIASTVRSLVVTK